MVARVEVAGELVAPAEPVAARELAVGVEAEEPEAALAAGRQAVAQVAARAVPVVARVVERAAVLAAEPVAAKAVQEAGPVAQAEVGLAVAAAALCRASLTP